MPLNQIIRLTGMISSYAILDADRDDHNMAVIMDTAFSGRLVPQHSRNNGYCLQWQISASAWP